MVHEIQEYHRLVVQDVKIRRSVKSKYARNNTQVQNATADLDAGIIRVRQFLERVCHNIGGRFGLFRDIGDAFEDKMDDPEDPEVPDNHADPDDPEVPAPIGMY